MGVSATAVVADVQQQRKAEQAQAARSLKLAADLLNADYHVPNENIQCHILPAAGGASGVAESIVEFSRSRKADVLVMGQRGMGMVKRTLMSIVGLGSVSDYCMHKVACPVVVVRSEPGREPQPCVEALPLASLQPPKDVCVAIEDSPYSSKALTWTLDQLLQPQDRLHIVTVAQALPFPIANEPFTVHTHMVAEDSGPALVARAVEEAQQHGVMKSRLKGTVLEPEGGSSDVGNAIVKYAKDNNIDVVVAGSRGMGAMTRKLMAAVGVGSVSDFLAHNLPCSLAVVRADVELSQKGAEESALMAPIQEGAGEGDNAGSHGGSGSLEGAAEPSPAGAKA